MTDAVMVASFVAQVGPLVGALVVVVHRRRAFRTEQAQPAAPSSGVPIDVVVGAVDARSRPRR
jgi:hypothetical protein